MVTPQDIQEISFEKAVFGGYDMQSVDEFLEPLTQDYLTLYKENAVLKSKMRLLVDKLEEYRQNEQSMKNAIVAAQKTSDEMVAAAEAKCAALLANAEEGARSKSRDIDAAISGETERLNQAKRLTASYIDAVESEIKRQLQQLDALKQKNIATELPQSAPRKAFDYETQQPEPAVIETADEIVSEIEQSVEKIIGTQPVVKDMSPTKVMPAVAPAVKPEDKFSNLQFGKNYDPRK